MKPTEKIRKISTEKIDIDGVTVKNWEKMRKRYGVYIFDIARAAKISTRTAAALIRGDKRTRLTETQIFNILRVWKIRIFENGYADDPAAELSAADVRLQYLFAEFCARRENPKEKYLFGVS